MAFRQAKRDSLSRLKDRLSRAAEHIIGGTRRNIMPWGEFFKGGVSPLFRAFRFAIVIGVLPAYDFASDIHKGYSCTFGTCVFW